MRHNSLLIVGALLGMSSLAAAQPVNLAAASDDQARALSPVFQQLDLTSAHEAVERRRWTAAEAALERAETDLLNGGAHVSNGGAISPSSAMSYIVLARVDVRQHSQWGALLAIDQALRTPPVIATSTSHTPAAPPLVLAHTGEVNMPPVAPAPIVTKALLPGRWELVGWQYHWGAADTNYRPVTAKPYIPGHYEYRNGDWMWAGGHYGSAENIYSGNLVGRFQLEALRPPLPLNGLICFPEIGH